MSYTAITFSNELFSLYTQKIDNKLTESRNNDNIEIIDQPLRDDFNFHHILGTNMFMSIDI